MNEGESIPPPRRPFAPVLLRISLATFAVLLFLLAAGGWWGFQRHVAEVHNGTESVVRLLANQTARSFEATDLALLRLVDVASVVDWSDPLSTQSVESEVVALRFRLPFISRVFVVGQRGVVRASTLGDAARSIDASQRDYFKAMRDGSTDLFVSSRIQSLADGEPVVLLARRIGRPDGSFGGVAVISFLTNDLKQFFSGLSVGYASVMLIVGPDGNLLVREPEEQSGDDALIEKPLLTAMAISRSEGMEWGQVETEKRYWSFRRAGTFPVTVAVGASLEAMWTAWLRYVTPYAGFVLSALAALGTLMYVAYRHAGLEDAYRRRLAETNTELERRVGERTSDLEGANTRLRGALEERDVLLREIHHRVKNNMQVIASLLSIQSNSVNPELRPYFQDNMQRIRAMARIHESLYASDNLSQVDFGAYLASLCGDLKHSFGAGDRVEVEIAGPHLSFPIDTATPLGLLLSEVISNSLKHGYHGDAQGRIRIAIEKTDIGTTFQVCDDGAGIPPDLDLATERSMGLRLIRILAQQLGATYAYERPEEGGTLFRLTLPRPAGN